MSILHIAGQLHVSLVRELRLIVANKILLLNYSIVSTAAKLTASDVLVFVFHDHLLEQVILLAKILLVHRLRHHVLTGRIVVVVGMIVASILALMVRITSRILAVRI